MARSLPVLGVVLLACACAAGPAPVDPLDAVHVARVLDAARVAATDGRAVKLA